MKHYLAWLCFILSILLAGCASQPKVPQSQPAASESEKTDETRMPEQAAAMAKLEQFFGQIDEREPQKTSPDTVETVSAPQQGVAFQARETRNASRTPELQPIAQDGEGTVGLNFDNADIYDVTKVVSEITGKSFIIDQKVKGTVTIFTQVGMTPDQIFDLYKTVLDLNGLAIVQVGDFYKIQPKEGTLSDRLGSVIPSSSDESLVTQVVRLRYIHAEDAQEALKEFVPESKEVQLYPDKNRDTLIITDTAANVRKILAVLEQIDVSEYASQYFQIFPIKHADLTDLVYDLIQILSLRENVGGTEAASVSIPATPAEGEQASPTTASQAATPQATTSTKKEKPVSQLIQPGTKTRIYPIQRLNALAVSTNQPDVIKLVEQWVSILDQPAAEGSLVENVDQNELQTYFYAVQYYDKASDLAKILAQVYSEINQSEQEATTSQQTSSTRQQQSQNQTQQTTPELPAVQSFGTKTKFTAEDINNTIIIKATPPEYAKIRTLLEKLDQRPLQVLIDVIIAEVQLNDTDVFGVQGMVLGEGQLTTAGETNAIETTTSTVFENVMPEGAEGFLFVASASGRFLSKLRALATENRLKVLSDPHILVRHNEEATIDVGDRIPISQTTGTGDNLQKNITYQQTGISLKVTPRINREGDVVLDIAQEVSDVGQESFGDTGAASFTTRKTNTSVVTQDNHPLIMGGLIQDRGVIARQGVPLLKDIPLLGRAFRYNEQQNRRVELIILVTPRVIKDQDEGWVMTENILSERIKDLEKFFNREETDTDRIKRYLKMPFQEDQK